MPKVKRITKDGFETLDGSIISAEDHIFVAVKARPPRIGEFFMGFQQAFVEIAKDKELRGETGAILNYLMGKMDYENFVCIEQRVIAADLGIHRTNTSTAFKKLVSKGILTLGEKQGRNNTYRINWNYVWRGKSSSLTKQKKKAALKLIKGSK